MALWNWIKRNKLLGEIIRASRRKAPGKNFDFERRRIPGCENFSEIVSGNTKRKGRGKRGEQLGFNEEFYELRKEIFNKLKRLKKN